MSKNEIYGSKFIFLIRKFQNRSRLTNLENDNSHKNLEKIESSIYHCRPLLICHVTLAGGPNVPKYICIRSSIPIVNIGMYSGTLIFLYAHRQVSTEEIELMSPKMFFFS